MNEKSRVVEVGSREAKAEIAGIVASIAIALVVLAAVCWLLVQAI